MSHFLCYLNIQTLFFARYDLYVILHFASHIVTRVSSEESSGHLIVVLECGSVEVQLKKQTTTSIVTGFPRFVMCHSDDFLLEITYWWLPESTAVKNYRSTFHVELSNVSISFCAVSGIWAEQTYKNSMVHCSQWCYCTVERVKRNAGKYESESGKNWASLLFFYANLAKSWLVSACAIAHYFPNANIVVC